MYWQNKSFKIFSELTNMKTIFVIFLFPEISKLEIIDLRR